MADTDAFVPDSKSVGIAFFTLLIIIIIIFGSIALIQYINPKPRNYGPIKNGYSHKLVSDVITHTPVKNKHLECPLDPLKYSFAFFLNINDYYCNRGYWKCVMIKGSPVQEEAQKCISTITSLDDPQYKCDSKNYGIDDDDDAINNKEELINLKNKIDKVKEDGVKINPDDTGADLFKRLELICLAIQAGDLGIDMLTHAIVNCKIFRDENGDEITISEGICRDYIKKHRLYCDKVYAINKKVARQADLDRIKQINDLAAQADALEAQSIKSEKAIEIRERIEAMRKHANKERKYDDYDSLCSADNYLNDYPGLIPSTIEIIKENDIINLSKKNNMDLIHSLHSSDNLEGCHKLNKDNGDELNVVLDVEIPPGSTDSDIVQICNREARRKGYDYFGINKEDTDNESNKEPKYTCYGYNLEDAKGKEVVEANNCENRVGTEPDIIYISKIRDPGEEIVSDCWRNVINRYPYQSPGVWLHPFVNNIRVVFTTQSSQNYNRFVNDLSHANKGNPYNMEVASLKNPPPEHPGKDDIESADSCKVGTIPADYNQYRESFDILNVPINNEFHLSIVVNDHIVEVYINAELKQTIKLFGEPMFSNGDLHINPEKIPKLGGTVEEFQFFPMAINFKNIKNIMEKKVAEQSRAEILLDA